MNLRDIGFYTSDDTVEDELERYGLRGSKNTPGRAHENGDVESSHRGCKNALDQRLRLRGSRNFQSVESYWQFVEAHQRTRSARARKDVKADES